MAKGKEVTMFLVTLCAEGQIQVGHSVTPPLF